VILADRHDLPVLAAELARYPALRRDLTRDGGCYLAVDNRVAAAHLEQGDVGAARREVAARGIVMPRRDRQLLAEAAVAADVAVGVGDGARAAELYEVLRPFAGRLALAGPAVSCHGPVDLYLGRLAAALGRRDEALVRFEAALALGERLGASPWEAHARLGIGELLTGDTGTVQVRAARDLALRLGMPALVRRADALLSGA
jgi:hypothetical protein